MRNHPRRMAQGAILAALYVVLSHFQNLLFPGSGSWAIQLRFSECLCVLAFFTPAAVPGLALGCLIFNLTSGAALPLDFFLGTLATVLAARTMWLCRRHPFSALFLPALFNGLLVGWELSVYVGGGFLMNAVYVAFGEAIVLLLPGSLLYRAIKTRRLDQSLFSR